ncbi:hypothetical protein ACHAWF_018545 [Thalassiosira exigua]
MSAIGACEVTHQSHRRPSPILACVCSGKSVGHGGWESHRGRETKVRRNGHALGAGVDSPPISTEARIRPQSQDELRHGHQSEQQTAVRNERRHGSWRGGQGCPQCRSSWSGTTARGGASSGRSSAATRIRAIRMGCPQLSMHSIRETMGARDFAHGLALFRAFFDDFSSVDSSIVN